MSNRTLRHSSFRRASTTALALLAACGGPTEPPPQEGMAQLAVSANVAGMAVATMVVRVSAADINPPLVFNLDIVNGQATGTVVIPAGSNRRLQLEAFDANSVKTHDGETTIAIVRPGTTNDPVSITLNPIPGHQPINVNFGAFALTVSGTTTVGVAGTTQLSVAIRNAAGQPVTPAAGDVRWASDNPAIATVNATGLVTGVARGTVTVMATYRGAGGSATITVN
jgi:Bacterial Ig-like domain (group 2)